VPGSPNGRGGLEYLGDDIAAYRRVYEIKSKDDPARWEALARLTRVLNTTPPDQLEKALAPMLNLDGVLKFLALEVALVNNDGYWTRASDYSLYRDTKGVFHLFPHYANETFWPGGGGGRGRGPGGPGAMGPGAMGPGGPPPGGRMGPPPGGPGGGGQGRGGMRMGGAELDPLVGLDDATKPLRSKLLAVPALRAKYLQYVKEIATKWLDWNTIGPLADRYQALIRDDVARDTRKLDTIEAFDAGIEVLRDFAARRRAFLLSNTER
jgi:spore coat protein CotH